MKALRTSKVLIGTGEASWSNAVACHRDITRASTIRKPLRQRITGEVQIGQHRPRRLSLAASNWPLSRYPCSKPITSVPISICVVAKAEVRKDKQQRNKTKAKTKKKTQTKTARRKTTKTTTKRNTPRHASEAFLARAACGDRPILSSHKSGVHSFRKNMSPGFLERREQALE